MMRTLLMISAFVLMIGAGCAGCEQDTPQSHVLPPGPDSKPVVPPPPSPRARMSGRDVFAGVTHKLGSPAGNAREGRGDLVAVFSKIQGGALNVWLETKGPVDVGLFYRFWLTNKANDPIVMILFEKGAQAVQIQQSGRVFGRLSLGIDATDGLLVRLPLKDLPPGFSTPTRLWVSGTASLDLVTKDGKTEEVVYDSIPESIEIMVIPGP
ncbi:MAG: hypothetical protein HY897_00835 [Deltaproteobacteria bacterium]|nr:hypothetical protein [Deltaproteobacteria bacterium]